MCSSSVRVALEKPATQLTAAISAVVRDGSFCDLQVNDELLASNLLLTAAQSKPSLCELKTELSASSAAAALIDFVMHRRATISSKDSLWELYKLSHTLGIAECEEACRSVLTKEGDGFEAIQLRSSDSQNQEFVKSLQALFLDDKFCDGWLEVPDEENKMVSIRIRVHKIVVAAAVGYLKPLWSGPFQNEGEDAVLLADASRSIVMSILSLIYHGAANIAKDCLLQTYFFADKLGVNEYILSGLTCALEKEISIDNVWHFCNINSICPDALRIIAIKKAFSDLDGLRQNIAPELCVAIFNALSLDTCPPLTEELYNTVFVGMIQSTLKSSCIGKLDVDGMVQLLRCRNAWTMQLGIGHYIHMVVEGDCEGKYIPQAYKIQSRDHFKSDNGKFLFFQSRQPGWVFADSANENAGVYAKALCHAQHPFETNGKWKVHTGNSQFSDSDLNICGQLQLDLQGTSNALLQWCRGKQQVVEGEALGDWPELSCLHELISKLSPGKSLQASFSSAFKSLLSSKSKDCPSFCLRLLETAGVQPTLLQVAKDCAAACISMWSESAGWCSVSPQILGRALEYVDALEEVCEASSVKDIQSIDALLVSWCIRGADVTELLHCERQSALTLLESVLCHVHNSDKVDSFIVNAAGRIVGSDMVLCATIMGGSNSHKLIASAAAVQASVHVDKFGDTDMQPQSLVQFLTLSDAEALQSSNLLDQLCTRRHDLLLDSMLCDGGMSARRAVRDALDQHMAKRHKSSDTVDESPPEKANVQQ